MQSSGEFFSGSRLKPGPIFSKNDVFLKKVSLKNWSHLMSTWSHLLSAGHIYQHFVPPEVGEPVDGEVQDEAPAVEPLLRRAHRPQLGVALGRLDPGGNCIKIGLPGKSILSKRKGLLEVIFSSK